MKRVAVELDATAALRVRELQVRLNYQSPFPLILIY